MKHFSWILTLPLTVAVVVFSVNNIADMPVDLWPFGIVAMWPTYLVVLLAIVVGFLFGGALTWLSGGTARREARRQRAEVRRLAHELESLRRATELARASDRRGTADKPTLPATVGD